MRRRLLTLLWVVLMGWTVVAFGAAVWELKPEPEPTWEELHQCEEDEAQLVTPEGLACVHVSAVDEGARRVAGP